MLQNPKHELFAQGIAKGLGTGESYVAAGFKPNRAGASRLAAKDNISARVLELLEKTAKRTEVTIYSLSDELDEARAVALREGQASAAVSATLGKAKLFGLGNETKVNLTGRLTLEQLVETSIRDAAKKADEESEQK